MSLNKKNSEKRLIVGAAGIPARGSYFALLITGLQLCFERFFPFVFFERGDSLSFIYGIYGHENLFS